MATIRRFPGLRCERCNSDEFEYNLTCNVSNEVVGGKEYKYELELYCAHCPRVFPICGIRNMDDFSELYPSEYNYSESMKRREKFESGELNGGEYND